MIQVLIPWFYFGPVSVVVQLSALFGHIQTLMNFWQTKSNPCFFPSRIKKLIFLQSWDTIFQKKKKKKGTAILEWTGSNLLVSFHVDVLVGSCALNIPSKNKRWNFDCSWTFVVTYYDYELLWSPWTQMARNSWRLHSLKLTDPLKMVVSTRNLLFHGFIFRDYVSLPECISRFPPTKIEHQNHQFPAPRLNDLFGIQARGGCACAGPYGQNLLGLDASTAHAFDKARGVFFWGENRINHWRGFYCRSPLVSLEKGVLNPYFRGVRLTAMRFGVFQTGFLLKGKPKTETPWDVEMLRNVNSSWGRCLIACLEFYCTSQCLQRNFVGPLVKKRLAQTLNSCEQLN